MPKALITHALLSTAVCPPGKTKLDYYDTLIPGMVAEIGPSGRVTLAQRYMGPDGKQRQAKLGRWGDITVAAARKRAQQIRAEVAMGGDPNAKKAEAKSIPTYAAIASQHLVYAKLHLKSYEDTESIVRNHLMPKWGKVRVTDITRSSVAQWLAEKRSAGLAPATVEKLRVSLGRSFELAAQEGVPGCERNPTKGLGKRVNNVRTRFLTAEEASRLRDAVAASNNPQLRHIVGLLLLTGARMRELLDAKWEHVDLDRRSWLIPTSKTGRARHVPLSGPAVEIMQALPRFKGCGWLVPNPDTLKPFVSIKHGWQQAIKRARLPGLRIHDLRHSAASFMVNAGVDLFAVGKVLGHANYQSTQRYAHLANDTLLKAVEAGAAKQAC